MHRRAAALTVTALLAAFAAVPTVASAATTIGPATSTLTNIGLDNNSGCFGNCTFIPFTGAAPGTPRSGSPISGVIVRWRLGNGSGSASVKLRVLRPNGAGAFSGAGTSAQETSSGTTVDTFNARLRVRAGDAIGLDNGSAALLFKPGVAGEYPDFFGPMGSFLPDSGAASTPMTGTNGYQLQLNADVEPDADNDGFGDQTQDGCPGDPARQAPPCATGPVNPNVDTTVPVISNLKLSARRFTYASGRSRLARIAPPKGTTISFTLSEDTATTLTFIQRKPGHRASGRCRAGAGKPRCTRLVQRGALTVGGRKGPNRLRFTGRLANGRKLPAGSYNLTLDGQDAAGNGASVRRASFMLVASPGR